MLADLALLSAAKRLLRFATDPSINLDCVSDDLIPSQETDLVDFEKSQAVALAARIDRRKGAWGRVRRMIEHRLITEPAWREC